MQRAYNLLRGDIFYLNLSLIIDFNLGRDKDLICQATSNLFVSRLIKQRLISTQYLKSISNFIFLYLPFKTCTSYRRDSNNNALTAL